MEMFPYGKVAVCPAVPTRMFEVDLERSEI
jgi:hypothetical protein